MVVAAVAGDTRDQLSDVLSTVMSMSKMLCAALALQAAAPGALPFEEPLYASR